jgi:hypothetical protein
MRLRKSKIPSVVPRSRSRPQNTDPGSSSRPAFSYYSSSRPTERLDRTTAQKEERAREKPKQTNKPSNTARTQQRSLTTRLSYWLIIIVFIVCAVKILSLNNDPKIIVISNAGNSLTHSTTVYQQAASKILNQSYANRNKITFSSQELVVRMQQQFPELQSVSVALPIVGNRPVIYLAPVEPSLVLQSGGINYAMSHSGVVLAKVINLPSNILPIQDQSTSLPQLGTRALPASTVSFAETIAYQLKASHVSVSGFVLPGTSNYELDVQLTGKPYIAKFNIEADAIQQSGALLSVLQYLNGKPQPTNYIDVRVVERAYYK